MNKGICFLDIDGTVNIINIEYKDGRFDIRFLYPNDNKVNNKQGLLWLSKLCIEHNLDIIIISSWSSICSIEKLSEILYNSGLVDKIKIIGKVGSGDRNIEINKILKENPNIKDNYIIVDDEDFYAEEPTLKKHLILCNSNYGFGSDKYYEARELLKTKEKTKVLK